MNPFETSIGSVPPERLSEYVAALKEYLLTAPDPNAVNADGQTCLLLALAFCGEEDGERLVASLIERGADPNLPSPMDNFSTLMTASNRIGPLKKLIAAGLRLNEVCTVDPDRLPTGRDGQLTLLDYALDIEAYLNKRAKNKVFVRTVKKHAGPLTVRRRFVADVIELLKANGAISAME